MKKGLPIGTMNAHSVNLEFNLPILLCKFDWNVKYPETGDVWMCFGRRVFIKSIFAKYSTCDELISFIWLWCDWQHIEVGISIESVKRKNKPEIRIHFRICVTITSAQIDWWVDDVPFTNCFFTFLSRDAFVCFNRILHYWHAVQHNKGLFWWFKWILYLFHRFPELIWKTFSWNFFCKNYFDHIHENRIEAHFCEMKKIEKFSINLNSIYHSRMHLFDKSRRSIPSNTLQTGNKLHLRFLYFGVVNIV